MKKRLIQLNERQKDNLRGWAFLAPGLLGVAVFFVLPFAVILWYSVTDAGGTGKFVFLDNFIKLLKNKAFRQAVKNTLIFSLTAVPLAVCLSLALAEMLECKIPGRSRFRTYFLSPLMVPVASVILIWQVLFNYNGSLNQIVVALGGTRIDWLNSEGSMVTVVLMFLWKNLGYNMILFMAAMNQIPKEPLEAAEIDGAGPLTCFFRIKLRYLSPTLLFVTILSLMNSFKIFREVYLLTGDYPYQSLYMLQHFMNNMFSSTDYRKLSAAAVLMAIVLVIVIGLLFRLEDRLGRDMEE